MISRDLVPTHGAQLLKGVLHVRGVLHLPPTPRSWNREISQINTTCIESTICIAIPHTWLGNLSKKSTQSKTTYQASNTHYVISSNKGGLFWNHMSLRMLLRQDFFNIFIHVGKGNLNFLTFHWTCLFHLGAFKSKNSWSRTVISIITRVGNIHTE